MTAPAQPQGSRRRRAARWALGLAAVAALLVTAAAVFWWGFALPFWGMPLNASRHGVVPLPPVWVLEPWLWEDDANTAERVMELLEGYAEHDIPVRTILIDSPWSSRYNDFRVDTARYPDPEAFFGRLEDDGYRVVLWMTPMVNRSNDDTAIRDAEDWFAAAREAGYLAGGGYTYPWWKGEGGFIDYTNPAAMHWWRSMQQPLFDWGIDGWKLDGAATFFSLAHAGEVPIGFWQRVEAGWMTTRQYMDHYYRDEYRHGLKQNPEFATLSRSLDGYAHPEGFAPLDAAPVCWVGDQDHAWALEDEGIEEAIRDVLRSAAMGYQVVGSDIGGFGGDTIPPRLYMRWAGWSAFCGLYLNGGHGERRLWLRSEEELEVIRAFTWLHSELVPYMYSALVVHHRGGPGLMRPWDMQAMTYELGPSLFVAPIRSDTDTHAVVLPPGKWRYFFDEGEVYDGELAFARTYPIDEYPVFVRDGAILPLNVRRPYTGFGNRDSAGHITWCMWPREGTSRAALHWPPEQPSTYCDVVMEDGLVRVRFTGHQRAHILRIRLDAPPEAVWRDGLRLEPEREYRFMADTMHLWVRSGRGLGTTYRIATAADG